ncbi:NosR/NirI family protein [Laribacter hongkongensis]|uniref:NosR/NirI family protein n=1 Tax=Laribacter hongkongensis TaxID=168471 RepID=UPI001EFE23B8|nr:NosR/NirI family protein [Laribacter hongkongensis]MCG9054173.1 NosR/NirI family protein [Laribacter hongkongensis]
MTFAFLLPAMAIAGSSYEAPLPPELATDADMCRYLDCRAVMPDAESFSLRKGLPPYVEAYRTVNGAKETVGYVYLSTDVADIPAYSGKPVVTLVGMDKTGIIRGIRILKHSEPILLVGIPEQKLVDYVAQYLGHPAGTRFELGKADGDYVPMDAISGATVTLIAQNQLISRTSYEIAKQAGIIQSQPKPQAVFTESTAPADWQQLIDEGSIGHLAIKASEVGEPDQGQPYLDLYYGYLNAPALGKRILGEQGHSTLMAALKPGDHALFVASNGTGSFKGSGFVRGGIYDRIQVKQDRDSYTFRDTDYLNLYALQPAGAPAFRESGIFILRDPGFSAAYSWSFNFLGNRLDKDTNQKTFINFESEYWLPAHYLQGGHPRVERPDAPWLKTWKSRPAEITVFIILLLWVFGFYALRDHWERRSCRTDKRWISVPKTITWIISIGFIGFWQMAQPSVTQLLTLIHTPFDGWRWELFLSDPLIFLFWIFIAVSLLLWGRGLFCGWLCPFGSLSELLYKIGGKAGLVRWQFKLPKPLHDRLKWVKYAVFLGLVAASFHSLVLAEQLAEIEPFKTTFLVGIWNRSWPFVLFATIIFVLSLFTERPYCKYLCPLGAGLGLPSRLRLNGLKRKSECGPCKACATSCGSQAIAADGRIDPMECLLCLDCMVMYYDDHTCPPLVKERKRRNKAGLPRTPVGKDGYFIPLKEVR